MRQVLFVLLLCFALPAVAAPRQYALDPGVSSVEFTYELNGVQGQGTMPVSRADLFLDLSALARSRAEVVLDVTGTRTATVFATQALKSRDVLFAEAFPAITFVSSSIEGSVRQGATLHGEVTIRGVARPLTLSGQIYRRQGSDAEDLSRLTVLLTGAINRADFGASGYPDLVADEVTLRIIARLVEVFR